MSANLWLVSAAALVALQMAFVVIRRSLPDERSYLVLLGVVLAALVFLRETGGESTFLAYFFEGLAGLLTLTPRFFERKEAAAVERGELHAARRWALLRSLIVPGQGTTRRRRQIDDLIELREHGSAPVVRRLRDQLSRTHDAGEAEALHAELVAMLLGDRQFADGAAHFARHLGPEFLLRRPGLLPQLVHAYGELGELSQAVLLISVVERGPRALDPTQYALLQRARCLLLAYAGADRALDEVLRGSGGATLHPELRAHLLRLARARALSGPPLAPELEPLVATIAEHAALPLQLPALPQPRVTWTLIALNVAAFLAVLVLVPGARAVLLDDAGDGAPLARAGALFRPAVMAGEWWRCVTAMFLHANLWHLALNMYGLLLLGRFVEGLIGSLRFFVIYFLAGLVGAAATTTVGAGALSVGASGAIMGLLGALIVIVFVRRWQFVPEGRRMLLWNLGLLAGLQIYIGFAVPRIDNAAHVGGLVGGAAAALLFTQLLRGRSGQIIAWLFAAFSVAISILALIGVLRTPLDKTIARLPVHAIPWSGVILTVPSHFELDPETHALIDPYLDFKLDVKKTPNGFAIDSPQENDPRFSALLARIRSSAHLDGP